MLDKGMKCTWILRSIHTRPRAPARARTHLAVHHMGQCQVPYHGSVMSGLGLVMGWPRGVAQHYVARSKVAILEVYNLDESMAMLGMKRGLRTSCFIYSLEKTHPKSYSEMLACMQKYICMDERALTQ